MIQICLNGNRKKSIVPQSTAIIVQSAIASINKGATSIHFHVRDRDGNETLDPFFVSEQISQLRNNVNVPLGISTGEWIEPNIEKRIEAIHAWEVLPDFVSINFDEKEFGKVLETIVKKGIKIEAGLYNELSTINFIKHFKKENFVRILIEPDEEDFESALTTVNNIEKMIFDAHINIPILLHGFNTTSWPIFRESLKKNYQSRIGFEDTLFLENGNKAKCNSELVENAYKIKSSF